MIRFVSSLILLGLVSGLPVQVNAGRRICDQLLSSTAFSGASISAAELSPSAQAYVNIIQLYIKNANADLSSRAISEILSSSQFINPFASNKDSFSTQISAAIEQIRKSIGAADWQQIQKQIQALNKKSRAEKQDRTAKEEDTSRIFVPQVVDKIKEAGAESSPVWLVVKNRVFVVFGSADYHLYLYELVGGQLKLSSKYQTSGQLKGRAAVQVVNDRTYIAIGSYDKNVYLFEVENDQLVLKNSELTSNPIRHSVSWQVVGSRVFLAVATSDESLVRKPDNLYLYELIGDELKPLSSLRAEGENQSSPSWQVVGDKVYLVLSTSSSSKNLQLFELIDDKFELIDTKRTNSWVQDSPVWQILSDRVFVAVATRGSDLIVFELLNGGLELRDSQKVIGVLMAKPAWKIQNGRVFLSSGANDTDLHLFEFANDKLSPITSKENYSGFMTKVYSSSSWHTIDGRVYAAIGNYFSSMSFYELVGGNLEKIELIKIRSLVLDEPQWQVVGDEVFIAVTTTAGVSLIKVSKKFRKQGGHK